jgi:hypothetical protein
MLKAPVLFEPPFAFCKPAWRRSFESGNNHVSSHDALGEAFSIKPEARMVSGCHHFRWQIYRHVGGASILGRRA